jgi:ABC-type hemin transport system substrate-binding protein
MLVCLLLAQLGCDVQTGGASDDSGVSDSDDSVVSEDDGMRIVSLTPAITQMLIDMGKRDQLVGVSKDDDSSLGLPVCGSFRNPVTARIVELTPDVVLTESPSGEAGDSAKVLKALADKDVFDLKIIPHSRSIADVYRALIDPAVGLGAAVGDQAAAERARDLMELRIDLITAVVQDEKRPRVLMLINPTTLGAIGTGVTHDELLRRAGGTNALAHISTGYLTLDRALLQETIRPDIVLILEPGGSELQDGDARLRAMEGLTIPAVMDRRFAVIKHPHAMLPSTALPEVMLEMARVLHPGKTAAIQEAYDTAEAVAKQTQADGDGP